MFLSISTGAAFSQSMDVGTAQSAASTQRFIGDLSGDESGYFAFSTKGSKFSGVVIVDSVGVVFKISGKVDKSGAMTGNATVDGAKVKFTGQVAGDSADGEWAASWKEDGILMERYGLWSTSSTTVPSQFGTYSVKINGRTTRGKLGILAYEDGTLSGFAAFEDEYGDPSGYWYTGSWDSTSNQINFSPDYSYGSPEYEVFGEGAIMKKGSKGTLFESGAKIGSWSTKNM